MAEGTNTFLNLGVPLEGESEIKQVHLATDILTITGATSQTGDFLVLQNVDGTEKFVIDKDGNITVGGAFTATGDVSITGSFGVTGNSVFTGSVDVPGAANRRIALSKGATGQTSFARLNLPILSTAPASAGLSMGDIWLAKATTDVYRLALCISGGTATCRYGSRIIRATLGTASH